MPLPSEKKQTVIAVGAGASIAVLYGIYQLDILGKLREAIVGKRWIEIGKLKQIWIYPVKSLRGQSIDNAMCTSWGVQHGDTRDRQFIILNGEGKFVTIREEPTLALVYSCLENGCLTLKANGHPTCVLDLNTVLKRNKEITVEMWGGVPIQGLDCGREIGEWLTRYLGKEPGTEAFKLVFHVPKKSVNQRTLGSYHKATEIMKTRTDKVMFSDTTPYHIITTASLNDLNDKIPTVERKLDARTFRPNFELDTTIPFDEDNWSEVKIGNVTFLVVRPCDRCITTQVDPDNGIKRENKEPLNTLRKYRLVPLSERKMYGYSPLFGCNFALNKTGEVNVGDTVSVIYKK